MTSVLNSRRQFLTEKEVATWIGVSVKWVQKNRYGAAAERIPFIKLRHGVRYDPADVEGWLAVRRQ